MHKGYQSTEQKEKPSQVQPSWHGATRTGREKGGWWHITEERAVGNSEGEEMPEQSDTSAGLGCWSRAGLEVPSPGRVLRNVTAWRTQGTTSLPRMERPG